MVFTSFPPPRPLPGSKKAFQDVSARINSFGERKVVTNVPVSSVSVAFPKSGNSSRKIEAAADRQKCLLSANLGHKQNLLPKPFRAKPAPLSTHLPPKNPSGRQQEHHQQAKKTTVKTSLPPEPKFVPFRARPVPASTYKLSLKQTVRKANHGKMDQEQAVVPPASTCAPYEIADEPTVDNWVQVEQPISETASLEEPKICGSDEPIVDDGNPIVSVGESCEVDSGSATARAPLRPHPQGPGIPPFLPRVYLFDNFMPYAPQRFERGCPIPVYDTDCDADGTFHWDTPITSYRSVFMTPERFDQFRELLVGAATPQPTDVQGNEHQPIAVPEEPAVVDNPVPEEPVVDDPVSESSVQVTDGASAPAGKRKKPRNACYMRRQLRRAKASMERAALEAQMQLAEAAAPQVPQ